MKNLFTLLSLSLLLSCGGRDDEPTTTAAPTYTQADAVGTWKATHYQRSLEGPNWIAEKNNRTITYKNDGNFTSYFMTESHTVEMAGKYSINGTGNISTSNVNYSERSVSMQLSSKTEAILYINTPSDASTRKYKVVKQ